MAIDAWEVYIKCPCCGKQTTLYDYHENTSSERSEIFVVLNRGGATCPNFACSCGSQTPYDVIFTPENCHVEDLDRYKRALKRAIRFADNRNQVCFSDWAYDMGKNCGEEPALTHLIRMYPSDADLKKIRQAYRLLHMYGKKAVTKCELSGRIVGREDILIPEAISRVYLGDQVEVISPHTFEDCEGMEDIFLPKSVKTIGAYAFANSGLNKVHTSDAITHIGRRAFSHTWISRFYFPQNIMEIGEECFADCVCLNNLWIPKQARIGKNAFAGCCGMKRIQIHKSIPADVVDTWGLGADCKIEWYDE